MGGAGAALPVSARVRLARLAARTIEEAPQISATAGAGTWETADGGARIPGVSAAEAGSGQVDLDLHLIAVWPPRPLREQADELRRDLVETARREGLGDRIGEIRVFVHDLREPDRREDRG